MTLQICKAPKYKPAKSEGLLYYIHIHLSNNKQLVLTATKISYIVVHSYYTIQYFIRHITY